MKRRLKQIIERFKRELAMYRLVLKHPRTPRPAKWLLGLAMVYAVTPIDLIPDFIPVLGHLDDAIILPVLIFAALALIPKDVVKECRSAVNREATAKSQNESTSC